MEPDHIDALVIGGGPAGLMAAETLAAQGCAVVVAEAKPRRAQAADGRKIRAEPDHGRRAGRLRVGLSPGRRLARADPRRVRSAQVSAWAGRLGVEVFTGSSGRVFPRTMKASPLLRAWLRRLEAQGVSVRTRWRWTGWQAGLACFDTPDAVRPVDAAATVLALGGGSWARLGSDGAWTALLAAEGVEIAPFQPSNVGFRVAWSPAMARHFGAPVKAVRLAAGGRTVDAEFIVSGQGIEGGGIYALAHLLRAGAPLTLDLLPARSEAGVAARLARPRHGASLSNHLRKVSGSRPSRSAPARVRAGRARRSGEDRAGAQGAAAAPRRATPARRGDLHGRRVARAAIDRDLMLRARPGVFCAGEMLDWDAPTGGYLLTGCLATGRHAGLAAAERLRRSGSPGNR